MVQEIRALIVTLKCREEVVLGYPGAASSTLVPWQILGFSAKFARIYRVRGVVRANRTQFDSRGRPARQCSPKYAASPNVIP